ncbi:MAG: ACT domain-containing protein [Firmicutes bacterium]|nr:ACT domain-containing protein [Bacillota bacterium]
MILKRLPLDLSVCKLADASRIDLKKDFYFIGKTDEELSLVCLTEDVPAETSARDDGWKAFRIEGVLDFSLIGILSKISGVLADAGIGIFAVSTYNTDYVLVKAENLGNALAELEKAGYEIA